MPAAPRGAFQARLGKTPPPVEEARSHSSGSERPRLLSHGKAIRRVPNPGAQDQLPSRELSAPSRGRLWANDRASWSIPGMIWELAGLGWQLENSGWTGVHFDICAKNKQREGGGLDFKSTCALGRPNPGGRGNGPLWHPHFPIGFFYLLPCAQSS